MRLIGVFLSKCIDLYVSLKSPLRAAQQYQQLDDSTSYRSLRKPQICLSQRHSILPQGILPDKYDQAIRTLYLAGNICNYNRIVLSNAAWVSLLSSIDIELTRHSDTLTDELIRLCHHQKNLRVDDISVQII